jgi:ribosome-binding protein aMBF1 (putative translation factor)
VLGIAERQNTFEFPQNYKEIKRLEPLANKAKSLGDWIQFGRTAKNLAPGHLAAQMGIAADLVRAWENGFCRPDEQNMQDLTSILGCKAFTTDV